MQIKHSTTPNTFKFNLKIPFKPKKSPKSENPFILSSIKTITAPNCSNLNIRGPIFISMPPSASDFWGDCIPIPVAVLLNGPNFVLIFYSAVRFQTRSTSRENPLHLHKTSIRKCEGITLRERTGTFVSTLFRVTAPNEIRNVAKWCMVR